MSTSVLQKLSAFQGNKVLVIGDVILDIYLKGKVDRISPEAPIPILNHQHTSHALGGAANVAANLKGLGAEVTLVSITGQDGEAEYLETMLDLEEIGHHLAKLDDRPTTSKTRVIAGNQQMIRIDHESMADIDQVSENQIMLIIENLISSHTFSAIVLEDYNKGMLTASLIEKITKVAESKQIPVVVDPKKNNFFEYKRVTLFKPNLKECAAQVPFSVEPTLESLFKADQYLRSRLNHKISMITLAEHGIFITNGIDKYLVPTEIRQISDVSGAGDTVTAMATFGLIESLSLSEIATLSNQSAGHVCGISGIHAITKDEIIQIMSKFK
jgi:rfaE bifunctional protein kinase chain/domain